MEAYRIRSKGPAFRRAGLSFTDQWLELEAAELTDAQQIALLREPMLLVEIAAIEGDQPWKAPSPMQRQEWADSLERDTKGEAPGADAGLASPAVAAAVFFGRTFENELLSAVSSLERVLELLDLGALPDMDAGRELVVSLLQEPFARLQPLIHPTIRVEIDTAADDSQTGGGGDPAASTNGGAEDSLTGGGGGDQTPAPPAKPASEPPPTKRPPPKKSAAAEKPPKGPNQGDK